MKDIARRTATASLLLGLWFGAMLVTAFVTLALSHTIEPLNTASMAMARSLGAMTLGIIAATILTGAVWLRIERGRRGGAMDGSSQAADAEAENADATLVPIR